MRKGITFLIVCIFTIFLSCTQDEVFQDDDAIQGKESASKKFLSTSTIKSTVTNPLTPQIVENQIVIEFKQKGLLPDIKNNIRDTVQVKYHFVIDHIETCDCENDDIELWTIDTTDDDFGGIEDLVQNLSTDDDGDEDLNGDYQFTLFVKDGYQKMMGKNMVKAESKVFYDAPANAVNIAIIDTGIDYDYLPAPVLYNSAGDNPSCYPDEISGWDFVNNDNDPRDDHAHGTLVNQIIRDVLVQENVPYKVLPVKAFDRNGKGNYFDLLCSLQYIAAKKEAFLVNCSFGFYNLENQEIFENIVKDNDEYLLLMASAGNEGIDTDTEGNTHFPSGYTAPNVLTVGGYVGDFSAYPSIGSVYVGGFDLATESNYGNSSIDVVAAFEHNVVLDARSHRLVADVKGTSFACPEVVARAAKMFYDTRVRPAQLKNSVMGTSFKAASLRDKIYGSNIIIRGYYQQASPFPPGGF
ncbi:S8 family serine peptidase [Tenacibaculum sp. M341]|uniref:S8 family serine peptidase n=1 Tax=Tenacibaculum sp. M341 TaxID=2530339 RepID=UPI001046854F|nr:S8 family serine peptidase [Tenacibaculum sp. M341]TCI90204.1 hypothetical protein EYW44_14825 [Tenacibaculum sp. M341]